jgi:hypothetical protein
MTRRERKSGIVLILVLMILALLSATSTAVMHNSLMELKIASNTYASTQAFYLADSGIEHAKQVLREQMPWDIYSDGSPRYPLVINGKYDSDANGIIGEADGYYPPIISEAETKPILKQAGLDYEGEYYEVGIWNYDPVEETKNTMIIRSTGVLMMNNVRIEKVIEAVLEPD